MKTIVHLVLSSVVLFTFHSCECKKNATTPPSSGTTQTQTTTPASANATTSMTPPNSTADAIKNTDETVRLVVSFYSKGEGIDSESKDAFNKLIDSNAKKIAYEPIRWGREGEVDYCLELKELSSAEQENFVKKVKELLNKSTLVHIKEYGKCVHKN